MLRHHLQYAFGFSHAAAEGHHDAKIGQPISSRHGEAPRTLGEAIGIGGMGIA